jgi:5-methylcytosine-specific restriction protein A
MSQLRHDAVYNHAWRKVRKLVLERDGWVCQIKGPRCMGRATQVDHIIPWRFGGALYDPENLRASCTSCNRERVKSAKQRKAVPSREW